ncbi:MAG: hypothetical protein methR_P0613 [Methyloprofundus sp.]|nr:MAG: hypothetical protein methR_P0613 [Methyloprofundus sp.]
MHKEEINDGAATALKYLVEGWVSVFHDSNGSVIGLWVKYSDWGEDEYSILTFLCSVLTVAKSKGGIVDSLPEDIIPIPIY